MNTLNCSRNFWTFHGERPFAAWERKPNTEEAGPIFPELFVDYWRYIIALGRELDFYFLTIEENGVERNLCEEDITSCEDSRIIQRCNIKNKIYAFDKNAVPKAFYLNDIGRILEPIDEDKQEDDRIWYVKEHYWKGGAVNIGGATLRLHSNVWFPYIADERFILQETIEAESKFERIYSNKTLYELNAPLINKFIKGIFDYWEKLDSKAVPMESQEMLVPYSSFVDETGILKEPKSWQEGYLGRYEVKDEPFT